MAAGLLIHACKHGLFQSRLMFSSSGFVLVFSRRVSLNVGFVSDLIHLRQHAPKINNLDLRADSCSPGSRSNL